MLAWGPAAAWATLLFLLSELQGVPRMAGLAANDKLVHLGLYSMLGLLLGWGKRASPSRVPHGLALSLGFVYGAVDELHQRFVPFRTPSWGDYAADVAGLVSGYLLFLSVWALVTHAGPRISHRAR